MDKCCQNCGHYRDGKCYCQEEINFDESNVRIDVSDYLFDMVEEGEIDEMISEAESFTNEYNFDCLKNYKLTKKQREELKKELVEVMEDKLDDFKSDFSRLLKYKNKEANIELENPVNIFKVNNSIEFYCSRYWR